MAGTWNSIAYKSITLVFLTYVYMCLGCTPPDGVYQPPATEEKLYYSDIFAYGNVRDIYRGGYMYDTMYTVNFEVYCSFKGDPLPQIINITRAGYPTTGYEPGLCLSNNFTKGQNYFVFLNFDYTPAFNEERETSKEELEDIPLFCGVTISPPKDIGDKEPVVQCPEPYPDYEDCLRYTTPKPDTVVVRTMAPKGKIENMPADGTPEGTPEESDAGQSVSAENGENSGARAMMSLGVTALCLVLAVF